MPKLPSLPTTLAKRSMSFQRALAQLERHRGPAIVTSFGPQLYNHTSSARAKRGEILRYDPFQLAGEPGDTWSPLSGVTSWDDALDVAWRLTLAAQHDHRTIEGGDFWAILVEERLAPLLLAAAHSGCRIESLVAWAYGQGSKTFDDAIDTILADGTATDAHALQRALGEFADQPDRIRTSVDATIQALLRAFRFSRVAASAHHSAITTDALFSGNNTLYLVSDAKAAKLLRPLVTSLLEQLVLGAIDSDRSLLVAHVDGQTATAICPGAEALASTGKVRTLTIPQADAPAITRAQRRLRFRSPLVFG